MTVDASTDALSLPSLAVARTRMTSFLLVDAAGRVLVVSPGSATPLRRHSYVTVSGSPSGSVAAAENVRTSAVRGAAGVSTAVPNAGAALGTTWIWLAADAGPAVGAGATSEPDPLLQPCSVARIAVVSTTDAPRASPRREFIVVLL